IADLARDIIVLSGLGPGKDIDITFTGVRPGEKMVEELLTSGESYERTRHEKIFIAQNASNSLPLALDEALGGLEEAVEQNDIAAIVEYVRALVPEFQPSPYVGFPQEALDGQVGTQLHLSPVQLSTVYAETDGRPQSAPGHKEATVGRDGQSPLRMPPLVTGTGMAE